ncbi:MAG: translation initiation factor IF-1 [Candidatus Taylorbacteria bacterium]|nr:translation initiation factor IF-1 [Candidatus Taylorbacteria bacterium]
MDQKTNQSQKQKTTITAFGVVTEALPDTLFKVKIDGKEDVLLAYLAGKMRMHRIRVLIGDKVELELDSYGGRARITKRF